MQRKFLLILFIISHCFTFSQNSSSFYSLRVAKITGYSKEVCNTTELNSLQQFLQKELKCELVLSNKTQNAYSTTFAFTQVKHGIEVYHGFAKVILDSMLSSFTVLHDLFYEIPEVMSAPADACWYYFQNSWTLVTKTKKFDPLEGTFNELLINTNGIIISRTDLALYHQEKDTTIRVKVFNPDPLTTAHRSYIAPYIDYNDSDVAVLNSERVWKNVICEYGNDTFWLSNKYLVPFKYNLNNSYNPVFKVKDTIFDFTRHQHEFEDVMVFYHITEFQNYLNTIGFNSIGFQPTPYDAHGLKEDNSVYLPGWGLIFGTGGIDDAEDAPTILHEYSHSLREYASPSTNNGAERQALEEGFMDYFGTSYKMGLDSFGWKKFGYWDGNNPPFYSGRSVASNKIYPQGLSGNVYEDGEIWSSALMRIHLSLGKTIADKLCIQTLYYLSNNLSMTQTAKLLIKADTTLFNAIHAETIWRIFAETHILPWYTGLTADNSIKIAPVIVSNSLNFSLGLGNLAVSLSNEEQGVYSISNSLHQEITSNNFNGDSITLPSAIISAPGIYYLNITTASFSCTKKLFRL